MANLFGNLSSFLYRWARISNDLSALASLRPRRMITRLANKWMGRNLIRKGWFR